MLPFATKNQEGENDMFLIYAKRKYADSYFNFIREVQTEKELDEWVDDATAISEGIAWLEVEGDQIIRYRTFEFNKETGESRRASYSYQKHGDQVIEITDFYIDDTKERIKI